MMMRGRRVRGAAALYTLPCVGRGCRRYLGDAAASGVLGGECQRLYLELSGGEGMCDDCALRRNGDMRAHAAVSGVCS